MKIELSSQRREMVLFLSFNMAAVISRANEQLIGSGHLKLIFTTFLKLVSVLVCVEKL